MKLREILSEFSQPKLANFIQNWGGRIQKSVSKNELIDQLSALIQNPVNLEKAVISLTDPGRNLLGAVLMCDGNVNYARLSQLSKGNELKYNFSFYINHLESRGLFSVKYSRSNANIIVPEELMAPLKKLLVEYMPVNHIEEEKIVLMEASPIIDDIFRICIFSQNKGGIRLTQQGQIFKKAKQELLDILGMHHENRLEFAIGIMTACYLLNRDANILHTLDENVRTIFSKSRERITIDLIIPIIKMHRLNKELVIKFLDILNLNRDGGWIDFRDFIKTQKMSFFDKKDVEGWLEFDIYKLTQLVNGLYFLGILDLKYYEILNYAHIYSFKVSPFGKRVLEASDENKEVAERSNRSFIVSPNFEINVFGEEPDYYTMYRLGKIAQMLRFDTACTFRLEKEFVLRELTDGSTLPDIISFLEQHSKKELPQNVRYSILDWGSKFGKVAAGKGYIEIIDRSLCERVEQILSPYIVRSIKNPVIIFDENKGTEVLSRLRKADIFPSELNKSTAEKKTNIRE